MYLLLKNYARYGLLLCLLHCSHRICAQTVTISVENSQLEKVLLQVEKQTGYSFIYSSESLLHVKPVTITVKGVSLDLFLQKCFQGQPLEYQVRGKHIILRALPVRNVDATGIRGRIFNERGDYLPGLTVKVKGISLSTSTDQHGNFHLTTAPRQAILVVSGAEIVPVEVIAEQSFITIHVTSRVTTLDETVVIAYGKSTRRLLTGTVEKLDREKIDQQPAPHPLSALVGRISGLQLTQTSGAPGTNYKIRLRGQNSIANGNDPLFIIDGVPFPSQTLNGLFGGGASSTATPLDNINADMIESIEVLKDADATAIYGSRGANGVILITTRKGRQGKPSFVVKYYHGLGSISRKMNLLDTPGYLLMRKEAFANDGVIPVRAIAPDLLLWDTTRYTDWQDVLIGGSMNLNDLNATMTGGSAQTQFTISGAWRKETTVFPGSSHSQKYSGAMTLTHTSTDKRLFIQASSSFLQNNNFLPREDLSQRVMLPPNAPALYSLDGSLNWEQSTWFNPMAFTLRTFENRSGNLMTNIQTNYRLWEPVSVRFSGGYTRIDSREHSKTPAASHYPGTGATGSATFGHKTVQTIIAEPQIVFNRLIQRLNLELLAGTSVQQSSEQGYYQSASGYSNDELLGSIKAASLVLTASEQDIRYRYAAFFGRAALQYDGRYLLSASWRRDGSSRYGPASRFAHFGSIGAAWIFSKSKFFQQNKWLSFGKVKVSMGTTGNDQIGDYRYLNLYTPLMYSYQGQTAYAPSQLFNPHYTWEKVVKREAGIDMGLFGDRIQLSAQYYHNTTSNQLISYSLAAVTGFTSILKNIPATILNYGTELQFGGTLLKAKNLTWSLQANLSFPKNKLVNFDGLAESSYALSYVIGKPLSIERVLHAQGVNPQSGTYVFEDSDRDGWISFPGDQQSFVNTAQTYYGGIEQSVQAGRMTVAVFFQFVRQPHAPNYVRTFSRPGSMANQPAFVLDRWNTPGQQTSIQRFTQGDFGPIIAYGNLYFSDAAFSDASFIRWKNLYVSYQLANKRWRSAGIKDARIFIQGQNLLTISGYKGLDPETQAYLPPIRLLTVGLQVQF